MRLDDDAEKASEGAAGSHHLSFLATLTTFDSIDSFGLDKINPLFRLMRSV